MNNIWTINNKNVIIVTNYYNKTISITKTKRGSYNTPSFRFYAPLGRFLSILIYKHSHTKKSLKSTVRPLNFDYSICDSSSLDSFIFLFSLFLLRSPSNLNLFLTWSNESRTTLGILTPNLLQFSSIDTPSLNK